MAASPHRERNWKVRAQVALDELSVMADVARIAHRSAADERADAARRASPAASEEPDQLRNAGPVSTALRAARLVAPPSVNGAQPPTPPAADPAFDRHHRYVTDQLETARDRYLCRKGWWRPPWETAPAEGAWGHIHAANVGIVRVASEEQLDGLSPRLLATIESYLKETDTERRAVQPWFDRLRSLETAAPAAGATTGAAPAPAPKPVAPVDRHRLCTALAAAYDRIAAEYQRLRRFKWIIAGSAALAVVVVALLCGLAWNRPSRVPLCFPDPGNATTTTTTTTATTATAASADGEAAVGEAAGTEVAAQGEGEGQRYVCPSSDAPAVTATPPGPHARSADVLTIALFGLVGATFTCIPFLTRRAPPTSVPISSIRVYQAVLKAALGMLCAIVGLLLLRAGVVPGFTAIDTRAQLIAYAIVFGASQHVVTRLIDSRSNDLVKAVTAEDSDGTDTAATTTATGR